MIIFKCLEIFLARIVDVSLGTLRTVYFVKGKVIEPFIIAFFEILVWYAVAKEALNTGKSVYGAFTTTDGHTLTQGNISINVKYNGNILRNKHR